MHYRRDPSTLEKVHTHMTENASLSTSDRREHMSAR